MPRNSAFGEALSLDERVATALLDSPDPGKPVRRMSEFSAEVELLSTLCDRVAELTQVTVVLARGTPRTITPMPRPVTAMARARHRARVERHRALVARVLPPEEHPGP